AVTQVRDRDHDGDRYEHGDDDNESRRHVASLSFSPPRIPRKLRISGERGCETPGAGETRLMALVALSASYGAAGSRIGPTLAERLGVPFLDRAIPLAVAERLEVSFDDAAAHDGQASGSWLERMLSGFIGVDSGVPAPLPADVFSSDDFRLATEEVLLHQASTGEGVILGRAAVVVLREDPRALRVRVTGPAERRVEQAMRMG